MKMNIYLGCHNFWVSVFESVRVHVVGTAAESTYCEEFSNFIKKMWQIGNLEKEGKQLRNIVCKEFHRAYAADVIQPVQNQLFFLELLHIFIAISVDASHKTSIWTIGA